MAYMKPCHISDTNSLTFPLFIFTWRWLQDSRTGRLKPTTGHPSKSSSHMAVSNWRDSWRASGSTYRGLYLCSPIHGMTGLSDINICCKRASVAFRKLSTADCVTLSAWAASIKKSNLSWITCTSRIYQCRTMMYMKHNISGSIMHTIII